MGIKFLWMCLAFVAGASCIKDLVEENKTNSDTPDYRNFYGISWRGTYHDNLLYAKEMKYDYVFYQKDMERDTLSNGLYFYLESPEYLTFDRRIQNGKNYTAQQKSFYTSFAAQRNTGPFPGNLATGWFFNDTTFSAFPDYQQHAVINYMVDSIVHYIKGIETRNPKFHFGGLAWDVPQPAGDFWDTIQPPGKQVSLAYWTGKDAGALAPGVRHDFPTYSEGHIEFYKQLFAKLRGLYPDARFIMEPYHVYEDWIQFVRTRPDAKQFMPDILCQESPGAAFATDKRIFSGGLIQKDHVLITTPNKYGEADNRVMAAEAAKNGSYYNWFGRLGGTGDMPNYKNVNEVPPRLRLIRLLPAYENGNNTSLAARTWDGTTYWSNTAFADPKSIAVLQPGTDKYYVLLMQADAVVPLPAGKSVTKVQRTNSFFVPIGDAASELLIKDSRIMAVSGNSLNKVYILYLNK